MVRGNHDKACTGLMATDDFSPLAAQAASWTQRELADRNLRWLRELQQGPVGMGIASHNFEEPKLVHGSPLDEDEYILNLREALEAITSSSTLLTFFGHTHVQGGFALEPTLSGRSFRPQYETRDQPEQFRMALQAGTRYMINPGSVGQPRDGDWRSAFAIFDSDAEAVTFYRVPYDLAGAQRRIRAAKLPERLASRLTEGK